MIQITKTDFILYRECAKNAWMKLHRADVYNQSELSDFERHLLESGNETDVTARFLFPEGVLVAGRGKESQEATLRHIHNQTPTIFQPVFTHDNFLVANDILHYDKDSDSYFLYEVKSSSEIDDNSHYHDLGFQHFVMKLAGIKVSKFFLIHLNKEYVRKGALDIQALFVVQDVTQEVTELFGEVEVEVRKAQEYLSQTTEPQGCCCVYKGRSKHCTTFMHSNPHIPKYGVHDISNIGKSKQKLLDLIDMGIFNLHDIPESFSFSDIQTNQIHAHVFDHVTFDKLAIKELFDTFVFPLYFLDYETFNPAIPRFDGFKPYEHIPAQYSLHILRDPMSEPEHVDFLYTESDDPSMHFAHSLQEHIGTTGTIIVWNKTFEVGRNKDLAKRLPQFSDFMNSVNDRIFDLRDIFTKQLYIKKEFKGSTSIKNVLPALAPHLNYKELEIGDGGAAMTAWNKIVTQEVSQEEKDKVIADLKEYCGLDTYAMYAIYKDIEENLRKLV
ncbi:MAG: DUF2779 domain-containing protein [Bacteroidetes bacterium]|nr:DUF2779 domain-containing protein [Bacteroidota bacterium]